MIRGVTSVCKYTIKISRLDLLLLNLLFIYICRGVLLALHKTVVKHFNKPSIKKPSPSIQRSIRSGVYRRFDKNSKAPYRLVHDLTRDGSFAGQLRGTHSSFVANRKNGGWPKHAQTKGRRGMKRNDGVQRCAYDLTNGTEKWAQRSYREKERWPNGGKRYESQRTAYQ